MPLSTFTGSHAIELYGYDAEAPSENTQDVRRMTIEVYGDAVNLLLQHPNVSPDKDIGAGGALRIEWHTDRGWCVNVYGPNQNDPELFFRIGADGKLIVEDAK